MADSPTMILRIGDVRARTGLGRSTIYALAAAGKFPRPVRLTERASGWHANEIDEWIASRPRYHGREVATA